MVIKQLMNDTRTVEWAGGGTTIHTVRVLLINSETFRPDYTRSPVPGSKLRTVGPGTVGTRRGH